MAQNGLDNSGQALGKYAEGRFSHDDSQCRRHRYELHLAPFSQVVAIYLECNRSGTAHTNECQLVIPKDILSIWVAFLAQHLPQYRHDRGRTQMEQRKECKTIRLPAPRVRTHRA